MYNYEHVLNTYISVHTHIHIHVNIYIYMYISIYMYMQLCTYIYIYIRRYTFYMHEYCIISAGQEYFQIDYGFTPISRFMLDSLHDLQLDWGFRLLSSTLQATAELPLPRDGSRARGQWSGLGWVTALGCHGVYIAAGPPKTSEINVNRKVKT